MKIKIRRRFKATDAKIGHQEIFDRRQAIAKKLADQNRFTTTQYLKMTFKLSKLTLLSFWRRHRIASRLIAFLLFLLILFSVLNDTYIFKNAASSYNIVNYEQILLDEPIDFFAGKLNLDQQTGDLLYNSEYSPANDNQSQGFGPKIQANFKADSTKSVTVTDPQNQVSITLSPKFLVDEPMKDANRVIYPLIGKNIKKVYTLQASGVKEDIIVSDKPAQDTLVFEYDIELSDGLEMRLEIDGSLGVYGVSNIFLGDVSASTEEDQALLQKARENGKKNNLMFTIPAPVILEPGKKPSESTAFFELKDNILKLTSENLQSANYPISIDPTIYVETAQKLMRGNNESNIDFDVNNELIQKSQTTGARIDGWEGAVGSNNATWAHATATAGGYVYSAGGITGLSKPRIAAEQTTTQSTNTTSFTMNLPASRPAGDLYIALVCHDGTINVTPPAGWTEYADIREHAAYWKVGTDQGGGNEAASYTWTGSGSEAWAGTIMRVAGANTASPVSGTPGTGSSGGNAVPVFPATTPAHDATLVIRAAGADNDVPSNAAWVPNGHTKIASRTSGGSADCGFVAASLDTSPNSGVSTGTQVLADSSLNDTYGASTIAIRPNVVTPTAQSSLSWAQFDPNSKEIVSPNPGAGVCSGWCNESVYNLPQARLGFSMVAYNGYLYAIGGVNGSSTRQSTVYVSKLGANGEPQLWHPTGGTPTYWYTDTGMPSALARSYFSAMAYNNRMYILGGQTNASPGGTNNVFYSEINPNGTLGAWTAATNLPNNRHGHTSHIYNDTVYIIGGNTATTTGSLVNTVHYAKINFDGTLNAWVQTTSFTTPRSTYGGTFSTVWGGYLYLAGGCSAINGSGYCTNIVQDTQIASINSDGSIAEWGNITNLENRRIGYTFISWQGGLYRVGGCGEQNTSTGDCNFTLADVDYGVINDDGDASTVSITEASGLGNCVGADPFDCDLPDSGDGIDQIGHMLSGSVVVNGYLYVIGGCTDYDCIGTNPGATDVSGNIAYSSIGSDGTLRRPACPVGTFYGSWCVDSQNIIYNPDTTYSVGTLSQSGTTVTGTATVWTTARIGETLRYSDGSKALITARASNTSITVNVSKTVAAGGAYTMHDQGVAAPGITTFGERIYVFGGLNGTNNNTDVWSNTIGLDGSLSGDWDVQDITDVGVTLDLSYTYVFTRSNPLQASTYPGNMYIIAGCAGSSNASCSGANHRDEVYKCNILPNGLLEEADANDCTTAGQLQMPVDISLHSGTVFANYIYIIGGFTTGYGASGDRDTVYYARINDNNDIVAVPSQSSWVLSPNLLETPRRRGFALGYNGYIYAVGGFDAGGGGVGGILPDIEFAKIDVSNGSIGPFSKSTVTVNQRWGLTMAVSNSFAYVIGGCNLGPSPAPCASFEPSIQTFGIYNNDSGAAVGYNDQSDQTYATSTDRIGSSSVIQDGFIYVAGGCTNIGCTTVTNNVQYAPISVSDGSVGTWANVTGVLPAGRAWGQLEAAGGTLYYIGGQDAAGDEKSEVYYGTPSAGNITSWATASNGLPQDRTQAGVTSWNNRLYVVGGLNDSATATNTVYVSPQLNNGGNITTAWTSDADVPDVPRSGNTVIAYGNNLYSFSGFDGSNYLLDSQFTQINTDGTVDAWTYSISLPRAVRQGEGFAANGYMYLIGGRSGASTCKSSTLIAPISANTTIATGNNPTGVGQWFETNQRYAGDRYGAAVSYSAGKLYLMGGGCTTLLTTERHKFTAVKSQPQTAAYSRLIDTDTDVFPNSWLMNGLDNSIGARWQVRYRTMNDTDGIPADCGTADMTTYGQNTNFGNVTLGDVNPYIARDGSGTDIGCGRYFYFYTTIDASQTFGYPEDVNRGPTIADLSLFFTSDPNKRLRHGKTFTGGEQQPLDTPCRQSVDADCPLP